MTEVSISNQNKRLSELKQIAIDIVSGIQSVIMSRDIINKRLEEGRRLGFSDIEIGDAIRRESKGKLPDRTLRHYLPDTAKHIKHASEHKQPASLPVHQVNRRLVVPEEPTIPPRPQTVVELEPQPEPQRPKQQTYTLNSKTCKGWPCERDYIYEIEVDEENRNVTKMYAISD